MKIIAAFLIVSVFALGAYAQMGEGGVSPLTPEQWSQKIRELEQLVSSLSGNTNRYIRIGKQNVATLQNVMTKVDKRRYQCIVLETLRPGPVPLQPLPEIPLKRVENPLNMVQISQKLRQLDAGLERIKTAAHRYVSIGKGNIGVMHRFAEASRTAVCGEGHYSKCPMGFIYNTNSDSCFRELIGRFRTFSEAQEKCHQRGAHLPRVETEAENNAIAGLLQLSVSSTDPSDNTHAVWTGLQRNAEDTWQWVHPEDTAVDLNADDAYKNFNTEEEDETKACAYLCTMSNKWVKSPCNTKARVICERAKNPPPEVDSD